MTNLRKVALFSAGLLALAAVPAYGQSTGSTICDGLKGAAYGLCKAGTAIGCDTGAGDSASCAAIAENYSQVTGSEAPWAYAERVVFVTSQVYHPGTPYDPVSSPYSFNSLDDADRVCQDAADNAGLPGTYQAWLSTDTASPSNRFATMSDAPYVRTDGAVVAENWLDLTTPDTEPASWSTPRLKNPINLDEFGSSFATYIGTITGTNADGTSFIYNGAGYNCLGWTSYDNPGDGAGVLRGNGNSVGGSWTGDETLSCLGSEGAGRLYCFQQ